MQTKKALFLFLVASTVNVISAHEDCLNELNFDQSDASAYVRAKKMIEEDGRPALDPTDLDVAFKQAVEAQDADAAKRIGIEIKRQEDGIAINFISDNKVMTSVATVTIAVVIGVLSYLANKSGSEQTFTAPGSSSSSAASSSSSS